MNRRFAFWRPREREQDLERELRSNLELEAAEQEENGLTAEEARYAARRAFGNTTVVKEDVRDMWRWASLDRFTQDIRYGVRALRKNPGFTLTAVLTLALGIGANTAMFSVVDGVLLRPLPYTQADRLALVHVRFYPQNTEYGTMSIADYLDWKARNQAFEDVAIFSNSSWRFDLTGAGEPIELSGCAVTQNFFSVLRSRPMLGRLFRDGESSPTAPPAVVLSEDLWRSRFGASPTAIGRAVSLNGVQSTIVGVMPSTFNFPSGGVKLWTNLRLRPPTRRGPFPYIGIGRLKSGITLSQAQVETNTIGRQIERANPGNYHDMTMPVLPLSEALTGKVRPALLVMLGAVFLVLLIASANVANLMLVRSNTREREMAVRLSLGALPGRLVRQLLTESVLLAGTGGMAGLALAWIGIRALRAWNPGDLPRIEDVHLDIRVLAFAIFLSVLTGIVFGLAPALRSSRADLNSALKQGSRSGTASAARRRTHSALAIAEVALSFMLLIGGGLLLRSFLQLEQTAAGFEAAPEQVLTIGIAPGRLDTRNRESATTPSSRRYQRILDRVRGVPGVVSAALSDSLPPNRQADYDTFQIEGEQWTEAAFPAVTDVIVSPDYFRTLRIPLIQGRYFTESDAGDARNAIVISESLAHKYFRGNPIGHHIAPSGPDNHNPWLPIVGVVGDVKYTGLDRAVEPALYRLYTEFDDGDSARLNLVVRSTIARGLAQEVEQQIRAIDPNATLSDIGTLDTVKSVSVAQPRFRAVLIAGFAAVSLLLAAIGIYGVIAYSVTQRTNEIGIRMALGAQRSGVLTRIVSDGAGIGLIGVALGWASALALTRVLSSLLFATTPTDPLTFALVTAILVFVAITASLVPALRATRIDPVIALRYE
ncbi:MAG TPA: ABC transporter permease [Bryobacteraceae bacterium]|jgi:predicted permease|nr:ABC transporter permease [Bryobacteraceae bacterium]